MLKKLSKITIAIDGFSSTGKSTVAKRLAKELGYIYVDSGAMYRAVTLYALQNDLIRDNFFDKKKLIASIDKIKLSFQFNKKLGVAELFLNEKNVEKEIRLLQVSRFVSLIAAIPEVREHLVRYQRKIGKDKGVVMDGRDIGSVVFPDAELKIFLAANPEIRAQRRFLELKEKGEEVSYKSIYNNVVERDKIDTNRAVSPLLKVADAIEIDVSHINEEAQFQCLLKYANQAIREANR